MPVESIIVSVTVVAVFAVFVSVMLWVDRETNSARPTDIKDRPRQRPF